VEIDGRILLVQYAFAGGDPKYGRTYESEAQGGNREWPVILAIKTEQNESIFYATGNHVGHAVGISRALLQKIGEKIRLIQDIELAAAADYPEPRS
jgi:hypothetical protein